MVSLLILFRVLAPDFCIINTSTPIQENLMNCALCNNNTFDNISEVDAKSSERLLISLCKKCGLIQENPIPTADELKIYYSHNYRLDYKKTYSPKPKHVYRAAKTAAQRINFLQKYGITKGTLLDVGAGGGEFVYLAGKMGFQSQGVEPSVGYSEYAKNEYNCIVMTGELFDVQGNYDVITMFHALEHLPSPLRAFEKIYHLLNGNGVLFVEVPWIETNDASPHNIFFKAHIFYFSVDTLISCASQFFDVTKVDTASNLKILFEAKDTPTAIELPIAASVERLINRINSKGWIEYLFKGKGILKPIRKITRSIEESKAKKFSAIEILDGFIASNENW
jgi:2-polyprenyl-3-methyl-5-hydroxy-6-metoxy-1,4-benzoquinol methylase